MKKKILFLIKNKASFKVILFFLVQKFINIFYKKKIKLFKKKNKEFLLNKKISNDYFSMNAYNFYHHLSEIKKDFIYLEIGSYEGNSAMFVANTFPSSKVFCVDNWVGSEDYFEQDFNIVENNFNYNINEYSNIYKLKKNSDDFFLNHKDPKFDVIYVDGYHKGFQVLTDCQNSWKTLKIDGILICDDYFWNFYEKTENNPCYSINLFLKEIENEYKILQVSNSQIFIKKIAKNI
tara:strand:- start:329 stop:1033 length:705 start_codon:yes stop_codon:yes gene_type:complete